jgi:uncharacterized tellurite resistance protein B-like protein
MPEPQYHPALSVSEKDRIDYLLAVASIAWADRSADEAEIQKLRQLCETLQVSGEAAERVVAAATEPDAKRVTKILRRFPNDSLRFALLADVTLIAFCDGRVESGEAEQIAAYARELHLATAHATTIGRYVENAIHGRPAGKLSQELSDKLAALQAEVPHPGLMRDMFARMRGTGD